MMEGLGVQWAGTMLGCIAAIMIPIPVGFMLYGPWLRRNSKLACSTLAMPVAKKEKMFDA